MYAVAAKPFLGNFLLQVATSLSSSTPDDPNSHVSDFRSQPHHSGDDSSRPLMDESENSTLSEPSTVMAEESTEGTLKNSGRLQIVPWQYNGNNTIRTFSEIVGNIIGTARGRISAAFQRLFTPIRQRRQGYFHQQPTLLKVEKELTINENVEMSKVDLSTAYLETKGAEENIEANNTAKSIEPELQLEDESSEQRVSFQLDKQSTVETSALVKNTRPLKRFFLKRLERFAKRLNETRKQFRARTIRIVGSLIPLLLLDEETRSRGMVNLLDIDSSNVTWGYYNSDEKNVQNKFPLPKQLSRVSNNLLSLNADRSERAILALQNAFFKYAKLIINGTNNVSLAENRTSLPDEFDPKEGSNFSQDVTDDEDKKEIEDEYDIEEESVSSRASFNSAARRFNVRNMETIGILILEMFGSIAGLTWGALQQLQKYFQ